MLRKPEPIMNLIGSGSELEFDLGKYASENMLRKMRIEKYASEN